MKHLKKSVYLKASKRALSAEVAKLTCLLI